ncbi:RNA polymerase sigma factor [Actinoplanes sp. NPDC049265]|uniref:RNA polymerase sigma factor n=1 Tax=Actinoplanes sp. NPDC049265 TaxID=3363902 RepID=UPI003716CC80
MTDNERAERFRLLHTRHYPDLLRFVERRVPSHEAEDVISTVFMTAWRRYDDLPEDARPWLFAVARRTMANQTRGWLRRRALDVRLLGESDPATVADPSSAAATRVDLERAWRAQRPADRETLALVIFDGLSVEEAAVVAGCRPSTFAMRLSRARKRLSDAMTESPLPQLILREQS